MKNMHSVPLALVAGAGPGLGHAVLKKLSAEGYKAIGFTRSGLADDDDGGLDIRALDLTDSAQVQADIQGLLEEYGAPKIVIHNPAHLVIQPLLHTTVDDFESSWRAMVLSAFVLSQSVIPAMVQGGGGTFIISGATASLRGGAKFSAFASAKFALRGFAQSLAREYQASGIHIVHALLDGIIDTAESRELHGMTEDKMMKAEEIANIYWQLSQQPLSVWTHELDLRPRSESF